MAPWVAAQWGALCAGGSLADTLAALRADLAKRDEAAKAIRAVRGTRVSECCQYAAGPWLGRRA
jgi:hypothetical protein